MGREGIQATGRQAAAAGAARDFINYGRNHGWGRAFGSYRLCKIISPTDCFQHACSGLTSQVSGNLRHEA